MSNSIKRREALTLAAGAIGILMVGDARSEPDKGKVMTVRGLIPAGEMGFTLTHEHVLVDFVGADRVSRDRYDPDEVFEVMLPFLKAARERGVRTFVDCTPMYLGRDPKLLRRLSDAADLHILTNTGLYKEPFLPKYAFEESAEDLAARWIREFKDGIEGTDIRPGFIKIAVNPGKLIDVQKKIVRAAAIASKKTGLVIASHTGQAEAAMESIEILKDERLPLHRFIVVHSDGIADPAVQRRIAEAGAWVSFDGIGGRPIKEHVEIIARFLKNGYIDHLLLSHDAGWYNVGDPKGGKPRGFTAIHDELIPALQAAGVRGPDLHRITVANPQRAFAIGV